MAGAGRVAALYDIHGNLPALEAVLAEVEREDVEAIVVGGDVLPGPWPGATLARLRALRRPVQFVMGNGDREVLACRAGRPNLRLPESAQAALAWCAERIAPELARAVSAWPATQARFVAPRGVALFCHATPHSDTESFTPVSSPERLQRLFGGLTHPLVICGHTHMQFELSVGAGSSALVAGGRRVINAGSVGMPFDEPGAYWLLLGGEPELRRTSYDHEGARHDMEATGYPGMEMFRNPPARKAMMTALRGDGA